MTTKDVEIAREDPGDPEGDAFRTLATLQEELAAVTDQLLAGTITPAASNAKVKAIGKELATVGAAMRLVRAIDKATAARK